MPLSPGDRLGPYEILAPLGAGGMGLVYRARDPRLGRDVAIKVCHQRFNERFEREARAVAALNHSNICTLHDIGPDYLVMELVEGPTLEERIRQAVLPLPEALEIARQIAAALDAAHERGIVHRDLKPANIKLKPDGAVKVLDFGLAKMAPEADPGVDDATRSMTMTEAGTLLGTTAYMSPEQALCKPVDKRADIWAFGVVLYEMLTGGRLFAGENTSEVLAAVLTREPVWDRVPAPARRLLRLCLERDPRRRLRDIGDVRAILEGSEPAQPAAARPRALPWLVAGALALALAVALWAPWRPSPAQDRPLLRLRTDLGLEAVIGPAQEPAISPEGTRLVFLAHAPDGQSRLALRSLDSSRLTFLAGTEEAQSPFWAPDGQWIGFHAGGKLRKIPAQGGAVVPLADVNGPLLGASWGDNQRIVFTSGATSPLMSLPASGGKRELLTRVGEKGDATHRWPQVLPGGNAVLFTSHKIVAGFDDAAIEAVVLPTGERKTILRGGYFGRYLGTAGSGHLLYVHEGALYAVPFDAKVLAMRGAPVPVVEDIAGDADAAAGHYDVGGGTLIYRNGTPRPRKWPLLWMDAAGRTEPLLAQPGAYYAIRFSPDGSRLAMTVDHGDQGREIEVYDWQRGPVSRLTFTGEVNLFPVWSPDGKYIVFESSSPGGYGIGLVRSDSAGAMQRLAEHNALMIPTSFSPDGKFLAYYQLDSPTGFVARIAPFDAGDPAHPKLGQPRQLLDTPFAAWNAMFSPDGRWISYVSTETGRSEIYVVPFPGPGAKLQVSIDGGGGQSEWSRDGRALYFRGLDNRIMVSDCRQEGNSLVAGKPRPFSETPIGSTPFGRDFTLSPDGKRFAIVPPREVPPETGTFHVTFVLNFLEELRRPK